MIINETIKSYTEVLSPAEIKNVFLMCEYEDNAENFFEFENFINGYSIIRYGERNNRFDDPCSNIIDTNGHFVEIRLNDNIKYANGEIVKLKNIDNASYYFEVFRIIEKSETQISFHKQQEESSFFGIKVTRFSFKEDTKILTFIINSDLKVIASFQDLHLFGIKFGKYKQCEVFIEREFFFLNKERDFLVFTQKKMVISEEEGFFNEYMSELAPETYKDVMQDCYPEFEEENYWEDIDNSIDEEDLDEESLNNAIAKSKGMLDEETYNYYDIPNLSEINFFFEDDNNPLYQDILNKYFESLYGIIDTQLMASKQLEPFTNKLSYLSRIIDLRTRSRKEIEKYGLPRYGWDYHDKVFFGYIMDSKFFNFPYRLQGFTLRYVYTYYPNYLKFLSDKHIILIPNQILDILPNTSLTRDIRLNQESHLTYTTISHSSQTLSSSNYKGIISSYQGKSLPEIIYSKGGTKYLVTLLNRGKLYIEKDILEDLISKSINKIETDCYKILLAVIEKNEEAERKQREYIQYQMDRDYIKEANNEFRDIIEDSEAWGNL